ncbi:M36 family metallopeptidase [Flavobacterium oreochromis]|uniref:M36 family metallopeptidase n=1 Tax=Flavobacterium oreochromis TaxID=2906078 RepID=UPI000B4C7A75|nr:M36 family metallopeptidase [Flavobacterium oreochromis]
MIKKYPFLLFLLFSSISFSQNNIDLIKKYLKENLSNSKISQNEIDNLIISDEFTTTSNHTVCHVKQTQNGIPIYNLDSNFLIDRTGKVSGKLKPIQNLTDNTNKRIQKIDFNTALIKALASTNDILSNYRLNKVENNKFKAEDTSSNTQNINNQLVYFLTDKNELKLTYFFEYYSSNGENDLWNIFIDAETGNIIKKSNNTLKCSFNKEHNHTTTNSSFLFKEENIPNLSSLTHGTTNYKVIPWNYESPNHYKEAFPTSTDGRTIVTNPQSSKALAPLTVAASPNGWHNNNSTINNLTIDNSTIFNYTRGNNVFAYSDTTNSDPLTNTVTTYTNSSSGIYPDLSFQYSYSGLSASPINEINAATTNLFYMNNIMHDLWYQYGFDERNKNFQDKNYGRGGLQGDYVLAQSQDNSMNLTPSYNNANFSTPTDGYNPKMQMYLWKHIAPIKVQITSGTLSGTTFEAIDNDFTSGHIELPITPTNLSGELILFHDGINPDIYDGCSIPKNVLTNKIAVVRRGNCSFSSKAIAAQNAGAKALIIVNNTLPLEIGGGDPNITIPVIGLSKKEGDQLVQILKTENNVNVVFENTNSYIYADGDFDNGIIAHEYGHGISTRLSGNCLNSSEQMGEGWSDWFWLMMQIKPQDKGTDLKAIGTFTTNQLTNGKGIRKYPYTTNMSINPYTYADLNKMWYLDPTDKEEKINVHAIGSVWATILWDLTWAYINKYGYDSNIYNGTGGNNKVMKIVLDAIKIDGCSPSFITGRDAILAADQATTGGQDYELIWKVFSRRGVGYSASSGTSNTGVQGIKDNPTSLHTDLPPDIVLNNENFISNNLINVYPNPSNNGFINISFDRTMTDLTLKINDINGRIVYSRDINNSNELELIDLNYLQKGFYILNLKSQNVHLTKKIVLE